jgi:hypothetical protein
MRIATITLILIMGLSGCTGTKVVQKQFASEKILHINQIGSIEDSLTIDQYVFYLDKGDKVPLKLNLKSNLVRFAEEEVGVILQKKVYFRVEFAAGITQEELEDILKITADTMSEMKTDDFKKLIEKIQLFVSTDGGTWALITDQKGVKEVLGVEGGTIGLGCAISKEEGVGLFFSLVVREKPSSL